MNQSILVDDPAERQRKVDVACTRRNFIRCILDLQEEQLSMNGGMLDPIGLACHACCCSKLSQHQAASRANDVARDVYGYLTDDLVTETSAVIETVLELVSWNDCDFFDDGRINSVDDDGDDASSSTPSSPMVVLAGRPAMSQ